MNFSVEAIDALTYDFTEIPSNDGTGTCNGEGTIPEPSEAALDAYGAAIRDLFGVKEEEQGTAKAKKKIEKGIDEQTAQAKERSDALLRLTAQLCQDRPSFEDLKELPPRYCRAFMKWIYAELADPKLSTGDTPA